MEKNWFLCINLVSCNLVIRLLLGCFFFLGWGLPTLTKSHRMLERHCEKKHPCALYLINKVLSRVLLDNSHKVEEISLFLCGVCIMIKCGNRSDTFSGSTDPELASFHQFIGETIFIWYLLFWKAVNCRSQHVFQGRLLRLYISLHVNLERWCPTGLVKKPLGMPQPRRQCLDFSLRSISDAICC